MAMRLLSGILKPRCNREPSFKARRLDRARVTFQAKHQVDFSTAQAAANLGQGAAQPNFGGHCRLQNEANFSLDAAPVLGGPQFERAVCGVGEVSDGDGWHGDHFLFAINGVESELQRQYRMGSGSN